MNGQKLAVAFLALVAAFFGLKFMLRPQPLRHALEARALATRQLGEYLAATQSGKRVLVMSNPFIRRANTDRAIVETEEAGLRGLRDGLKGRLAITAVAYPDLRPEARDNPRAVPIDPETTTPLSYLVAPDAFDSVLRQNPGCDIVVSLIGLPVELNRCEAWQAAAAPAFALLLPDLRPVGDTAAVEAAVKSGKLLAFVARKPGGPSDDTPMGKDARTEFERRFLLVTRENIDQIVRAYPALF
jgi:hypothetical protein